MYISTRKARITYSHADKYLSTTCFFFYISAFAFSAYISVLFLLCNTLEKKSIILSKRLKFYENAHAISLTRDERIISVSSFFFFFFLFVGFQERCIIERGENLEYFSISLQTYGFLLCKAWRKSKNFHN